MENFFKNKEKAVDELTGVYNRNVIIEYANYLIDKEIPFSILLVDIDNFKYVNDTYGHIVGDEVLQEVSRRLSQFISNFGGIIGRFGGDEFILVFPKIVSYEDIWKKCHDLLFSINECLFTDVEGLCITITMGVARYPENECSYEKLLDIADKALYRGKMKGRNCFIIYLPEKHADIVLKTEKDKTLSSMFLHANVFNLLTASEKLSDGITSIFNFISAYFMFDHICIQTDDKIYFEKFHQLAKHRSFSPLSEYYIRRHLNPSMGLFFLNKTSSLLKVDKKDFYDELHAQNIGSLFCCEIACKEKRYGFLRVDIDRSRIWQNPHMDILLLIARTIGIILYERNITIENLV